jgi:flagellar biosynthetic protein FliR
MIDGQQAFAIIGNTLWIMLRIGAMLMAMPMVGSRAVPARVRVLLGIALSVALAPILPPVPLFYGFDSVTVLTIARELAVGICMGFLLRLIFEAGAMAGEMIAQSTGLAFAQMTDPLRGGSSGVIGQWFYLLFGLLFFTTNGHLAVVSLLVDSYKALPIGTALPDPHAMAALAPTLAVQIFRGALSLALPLTVAMLAINLAFGVLARAAPALNPMQLGLPVALLLGLFLLTLLAGEMGPPVQRLFDSAFDAARQVTM